MFNLRLLKNWFITNYIAFKHSRITSLIPFKRHTFLTVSQIRKLSNHDFIFFILPRLIVINIIKKGKNRSLLFEMLYKNSHLPKPFHYLNELFKFVLQLFMIIKQIYYTTIGNGFIYLRSLLIILMADALLTDDEPLWEPVEWSLLQSWILFIFMFSWIAENLITSRYGSYTGRDKRVWSAWYKTFWLIEFWYVISLALAALFVITPFYHELNYTLPFIFSWWNWYSRIFFFKFISLYTCVLYLAYIIQLNIRIYNWKKIFLLIIFINTILSYLLYIHFFMSFFGYFTDKNWYHKTRLINYVQLSQEPSKWAWGDSKRDHFSYHKSSTVFWFKNDGPFASAILFFHFLFFLSLLFMYLYWIVLLRRIYTTKEVNYTYLTFCISSLRQFFIFFLSIYLLVFFSFLLTYWHTPIEFLWMLNTVSWGENFYNICKTYYKIIW